MSIFLTWPSLLEYHMLPFALGACAVSGVLLDGLLSWHRTQRVASGRLAWGVGALMATSVLAVTTVLNNASNARVQLAIDEANDGLVDFLATLPPGSQVFVSLPEPNEYVYEIGVHLQHLRKRPDLTVDHFASRPASQVPAALSQALRTSSSPSYYVSPRMKNQPVPSVRLAFNEDGAKQGQSSLEAAMASRLRHVADIARLTRLFDLDVHLGACQVVERATGVVLCARRREVVENRRLTYGWSVYQGN